SAGDSFHLTYYLETPSHPQCLQVKLSGVKRHSKREHQLIPGNYRYTAITEIINTHPEVSHLDIRFSVADKCNQIGEIKKEPAWLRITLKPHSAATTFVYDEKTHERYQRVTAPSDALRELSNRISEDALDSLQSVGFPILRDLLSGKDRKALENSMENHGHFVKSERVSIWQSGADASRYRIRYRLIAEDNFAAELHIITEDGIATNAVFLPFWRGSRSIFH
ncbi:MAG: hypothetical protein AAF420_13140, partial [Pseudomonadota bacterium]